MDSITNPYSPGPGTPPPFLAGRDNELKDIDVSIARNSSGLTGQHLIYSGLRGVGKTVLLVEGINRAKAKKWVVGKVEGDMGVNALENICFEVENMAKELEICKTGGWINKIREIIQSINVNLGPIGFNLNLKPDEKNTHLHTYYLTSLFVSLGEAAKERGIGVMFVFDEMHLFDNHALKSILAGIHEINQKKLPFIAMGAGLPQLTVILQNSKTYAERLSIKTIGNLDPLEARKTIVEPAKKLNVTYENEALDFILQATAGYPYFLQLYGQYIWQYAQKSPITFKDAKDVFTLFQKDLDNSLFSGRYQKTTPAQRRYIFSMAKLMHEKGNSNEISSKEIARHLNSKVTAISQVRDNLIKMGLIFQTNQGSVGFSVPLFNEYLMRKINNELGSTMSL